VAQSAVDAELAAEGHCRFAAVWVRSSCALFAA
jgi:hypothetical protein